MDILVKLTSSLPKYIPQAVIWHHSGIEGSTTFHDVLTKVDFHHWSLILFIYHSHSNNSFKPINLLLILYYNDEYNFLKPFLIEFDSEKVEKFKMLEAALRHQLSI